MYRHLQSKHQTNLKKLKRQQNRTLENETSPQYSAVISDPSLAQERSWHWKYMTKIGIHHKCSLCTKVIKHYNNTKRHVITNHPDICETENALTEDECSRTSSFEEKKVAEPEKRPFEYLCRDIEGKSRAASRTKERLKKGWVRKYTTRIGVKAHKCNVCNQVLQLPLACSGNMGLHFKSKHPYIYAQEKKQRLESNVEDERENKEADDEATTGKNKQNAKISSSKKFINEPWVFKYATNTGVRQYECDLCKEVLRFPSVFVGNMSRHFRRKHPKIAAKENIRCKRKVTESDDSEQDYKEAEKECTVEEELKEIGEENYIIVYLVKDAENSIDTFLEKTVTE